MTAKEEAFHKDMLAIYDNIREHIADYTPSRFREKVKRSGGIASAKHWLALKGVSKGFERLAKEGKLEFTMEALILKPEYIDLFSAEERNIARDRLEKHGWKIQQSLKSENKGNSQEKSTRYWIFQAVPKQYDLKKELRLRKIDHWLTTHFRSLMKDGDKVIFWQAGKESGIYGVGELRGAPYLETNGSDWRVETIYTGQLNPPLLKKQLLKHPVLGKLRILRPPFQGTNFKANKEQMDALNDFVQDIPPTQEPKDIMDASPDRIATTTYRILRDTELAREVKRLYNYECQICGHTVRLPDGSRYAEAHHIQPLGRPHNGPDKIGNIVCVCPNHHAELDYGVISISPSLLRQIRDHVLEQRHVDYHNRRIHGTRNIR